MKKKNLMIVMLVAVLAFALGMGTLSYYKKEFTSNDNVVRAAKFEVDSNGTLDKEVEFDLTDTPIFPGFKDDIYNFEIDKKGTEVPVKYEVAVTPSGELFEAVDGNKPSPIKVILYRETEDGWDVVNNKFEIDPVKRDVERFKIKLAWDHSDYDIEYQNKTGKIAIKVEATQVDEEPEVVLVKDIEGYNIEGPGPGWGYYPTTVELPMSGLKKFKKFKNITEDSNLALLVKYSGEIHEYDLEYNNYFDEFNCMIRDIPYFSSIFEKAEIILK